MRVYINLDNRAFVVSPTLLQPVSTLYFTRRDNVPVEVQFVRGGSVVEIGAGATGRIGLKKSYAGAFLANDSGWTKTGTGANTVYTFDLNLSTTNLNAEFPLDTEDSITAKVEIQWTVSGTTSSTLPTNCVIYNNVIRGTESVPTVTATGVFRLQSPDNSIWNVSIDNSGVLTAQKA